MGFVGDAWGWIKGFTVKSERDYLLNELEDNRIARADLEFQIRLIDESDREIRRQLCKCAVERRRAPSIAGFIDKPKEDNVVPMRGPSLEARHPGITTDIARAEREYP